MPARVAFTLALAWAPRPMEANDEIRRFVIWDRPSHFGVRLSIASGLVWNAALHIGSSPNNVCGACLVERRTGETGNPRFRARHDGSGKPEICPTRRPDCDVRPRRHIVGRTPYLFPSCLLFGSRARCGGEGP